MVDRLLSRNDALLAIGLDHSEGIPNKQPVEPIFSRFSQTPHLDVDETALSYEFASQWKW